MKTLLEAKPMRVESMDYGLHYIWNKGDGRLSVVMLQSDGEAIIEQDTNGDSWHFEDDLIGSLHGPIFFQ